MRGLNDEDPKTKRQLDDAEQEAYLREYVRKRKIRDEERVNSKQRKKEARRRWWAKLTGRKS